MTWDEYRELEGMNWSSLKEMVVPLMFLWRQAHPRPDTKAFALGRMIHSAVLEPEVFASDYYVPETKTCIAPTKAGPQCKRQSVLGSTCCKQHGGTEDEDERTAMSQATSDVVDRCADSIRDNPHAMELLADTDREQTLQWTMDGIACKSRLDMAKPSSVTDIKTTADMAWFGRDAAKFMYHGQLAFYRDGYVEASGGDIDPDAFIIAVEKVAPFDCAVFQLEPDVLNAGRILYQRLLDSYVACVEMGKWPGRHTGVVPLDLPPWAPGMEVFQL